MLAATPQPPYVAVIFTSLPGVDTSGYEEAASRMLELAADRPGFLGVDSARGPDGLGITVSYWTDEEAVRAWRDDAEHTAARRAGRERWYGRFTLRVAHVTRASSWPTAAAGGGSGAATSV